MAQGDWKKSPTIIKDEQYYNIIHVGPNGVTTPEEKSNPHIINVDGKTIKVLISEGAIRKRIDSLADYLSEYYGEEKVSSIDVVATLTGGMVFGSDIGRALQSKDLSTMIRLNWYQLTSYDGEKSTGEPRIEKDLLHSIKGKHVLLTDDIADTLTTADFTYLLNWENKYRKPRSMKAVTLLNKSTDKRISDMNVHEVSDFSQIISHPEALEYISGFHLGKDIFLMGYGMDGPNHFFRVYPFVGYIIDKRK
ncbi:hypothetical protein HQ529_06040 [Candidatus Woesearchaeota archaeon]|nr:hypothetical protein [Candidatus Woesearchaeota archaeon]